MKTQLYVIPNALAATTAIIFVLCRILADLFPDVFFAIAQSWFHGIELSKLNAWNLTFVSFIIGLISSMTTAWIIGYIFVRVYRALAK